MNLLSFELSLVAVLPALLLCGYVFFKDRTEKEPIGLLLILLGAGIVAYIPSTVAEHFILQLIDSGFADSKQMTAEGLITFTSSKTEVTHLALCAFLGFSLIRICMQWIALFFITHKNKNFNYLFDGVVYAVFVSLGFAIAENIHFLLQNDLELLLPKLITSVACQLFIGIVIGYYYTMWHMRYAANKIENTLIKSGTVEKDNIRSSAPWLIASIVVPFFIRGTYTLAISIQNDTIAVIFYTGIFIVFGFSFLAINQIASKDESYGKYLYRIIAKGHPELSADQIKNSVVLELGDTEEVADK